MTAITSFSPMTQSQVGRTDRYCLESEVKRTFIRRTLASRRSCFTVFCAMARLLVAALLLDMTKKVTYQSAVLTFQREFGLVLQHYFRWNPSK